MTDKDSQGEGSESPFSLSEILRQAMKTDWWFQWTPEEQAFIREVFKDLYSQEGQADGQEDE